MEKKNKPKSTKFLLDLLDPKLRKQLQFYADREEFGNVSAVSRKAIKMFLREVQDNKQSGYNGIIHNPAQPLNLE